MKDTVTCPECNVENPKSRLTCQVCHSPLTIKTEKTKRGIQTGSKVDPKPPTTPPPPTAKVIPLDPSSIPPISIDKETKKGRTSIKVVDPKAPVKRRARRKSRAAIELQYFALEDGSLMPVAISLKITSMKKSMVKDGARTLLELWNRNKSLLQK